MNILRKSDYKFLNAAIKSAREARRLNRQSWALREEVARDLRDRIRANQEEHEEQRFFDGTRPA